MNTVNRKTEGAPMQVIEQLVEALMQADLAMVQSGLLACHGVRKEIATALAAGRKALAEPQPIDMVLHCPNCGKQHIDKPNTLEEITHRGTGTVVDELWTNPPHRSHQCHYCKGSDGKPFVWRPADVPTNGVAAVKTRGKADSPIAEPQAQSLSTAGRTPQMHTAVRDGCCENPTHWMPLPPPPQA